MKFRVIRLKTSSGAHSPIQVVEQSSGKGVGWINHYLDRDYVRRLAEKSLYSYAHSLLHFVRWWESIHHTGDISPADLTESTLLEYVRFQSSLQPPPSAPTINDRVACADRAIRNEFPDAPCQAAHGFQQVYLHRWAWADRGSSSAGCASGNPSSPSSLFRSMKWRASGPASATRATWPSWA